MDKKFTQEYFDKEYLRFWEMCSDKKYWQLPKEQRDKAFEALGYIYFHLDHNADMETNAALLRAANINYQFRESYFLVGKPN